MCPRRLRQIAHCSRGAAGAFSTGPRCPGCVDARWAHAPARWV
ncbi:MAG: hypothetical protein EBS37_02970 [Betaproteobacteria bacterium]|nr:hypothetical protein [Betaproteobacteria bacterium]